MQGLGKAAIGFTLTICVLTSCRKPDVVQDAVPQAIPPDPHYHLLGDLKVFSNSSAVRNGDGSITICAMPNQYQPASFTLLNVNELGTLNWRVDHSVTPSTFANACVEVPGGGWLVTGTTTMDYPSQASDIILFKLDNSGGLEWTRTYGNAAPEGEAAYQVVATNDGAFVLNVDHGPNSSGYLMKIDGNGDTLWTRPWPESVWIAHLLELQNGDLLISGTGPPDVGYTNRSFVARLSSNGIVLWQETYGAGRLARAASETVNGDLVVGGRGDGRAFVLRADASGALLWHCQFGGDGYLDQEVGSLTLLADGSIAAGGTSSRAFDPLVQERDDLLIGRISPTGTLLWNNTTFGDHNAGESAVAVFVGQNDTLITIGNHKASAFQANSVHLTRLGPDGGFE